MDPKALFNISYGVFLLSAKNREKTNACITNTCMQVASDPVRIAITCLNSNLTCEMIKESGEFTLSILDVTCTFDTIRHFGMQSGRTVDKLDGLDLPTAGNGLPYLNWASCAYLACKVVSSLDLGTHMLFIAEVQEAERLSDEASLTYADYQARLKPKPQNKPVEKKIVGWRCKICGYVYEGSELPADFVCPLCGHDASDFEPIFK